MHTALAGGIVCLASWLALGASAGNVGLQRSISIGADSLLTEQPAAAIAVVLSAALSAFGAVRLTRIRTENLVAAVLVGDAFAGLVLAPLAVGELGPLQAPLVFATVTVLGIQPSAALLGGWAAGTGRRPAIQS